MMKKLKKEYGDTGKLALAPTRAKEVDNLSVIKLVFTLSFRESRSRHQPYNPLSRDMPLEV
jgi:hypothetical protein